jgi:hypothetical protein
MQMLPSQTVSFWEVHVFHLLRGIGLFGAKGSFLHFENYDLQDVFLSNSNSSLTRKQSGRFLASNTDFFLSRYAHVSSTYLNWLTWTKWDFLHLEKYDLQELFFQNLSEVSQGNNVVETPASKSMVFFLGMHVFHQLSWLGLFGTQWAYLQPENYD